MKLTADPSTLVLPAWNRLARALEALRIVGGDGINVVKSRVGMVISLDRKAPNFVGAWNVARGDQDKLKIGRGFVNGMEPLIENIPISDPACTLDAAKNHNVKTWVCIKAVVNDAGKLASQSDLTVVLEEFTREDGKTIAGKYTGKEGLHPIALLYKHQIYQIAFFDYLHETRVRDKVITHYFRPG